MPLTVTTVTGDLLDQPVDAIVNSWNRNIIPWWLLLPSGVSGAIKRRAGLAPFVELGKRGPIPLGGAVLTGSGRLPFRGIIHVAGISMMWVSSEYSIRESTKKRESPSPPSRGLPIHRHAPDPGAGTGGISPPQRTEAIMREALVGMEGELAVVIVSDLGRSRMYGDYIMKIARNVGQSQPYS